jgi:hypothetical protein
MRQAGKIDSREKRARKSGIPQEEVFELELSVIDGHRLAGFVLHRRSGRREPVTSLVELTEAITRMVARDERPAEPDEGRVPVGD